MKIRYYSDLHLEFGKFRVPDPSDKDTVLILAGDIGVKLSAISFIERHAGKFLAVIYVAGNHEFYNSNINTTLERLRNTSHIPNLYFLENKAITINNVRFIGSTLWTDFNNDDWFVKKSVRQRMNDFYCIKVGKDTYPTRDQRSLTPDVCIEMHRQSLDFITEELDKDNKTKTVIITHHSPTVHGTNHERYGLSDMTYAYYTDLEYLMDKYDHLTHWVFGHTHKTLDIDIFGTRVLSNPRGYIGHEVNAQFNPTAEFTV